MTEPNQPMVKIYGTRGSAACYAIRDFLHRSDVPFHWIDLTSGEEAGAESGVRGPNDPRLPVCVFPDGTRLENATVRQITEKLGWFRDPLSRGIRSGDLWRRAGRAECGRLWCLGRAEHHTDRAVRRRGAGQLQPNRELPGVPGGHQRRRARRARPPAGMPLRRGNPDLARGCSRRDRRRQGDRPSGRRDQDHRSRLYLRHGGRLPPIGAAE